MRRVGELARKLAFAPEKLSPSLIAGIALLPPVGAGIALFGLPAAYDAGIAAGAGGLMHVALRIARRRPAASPVVVAVAGVGLIGPGAPLWLAATVAGATCLLEAVRTVLPGKALPAHSGLWAYAAVYLAGQGSVAAYLAPGRRSRVLVEPIHLWHQFFGGGAAPIDPVTLYVGNVAGPVFATSLLAVAVGTAWLWYSRRIDLLPVIGIACGSVTAAIVLGWNVPFQVLSGPLWFATAYCFAGRDVLAGPRLLLTFLSFAAGGAAVALRARGYGIELAFVSLAGAQLATTAGVGLARLFRAGAPQAAVRRSIRLVRRRPAIS